jgi:hypothetical protein
MAVLPGDGFRRFQSAPSTLHAARASEDQEIETALSALVIR